MKFILFIFFAFHSLAISHQSPVLLDEEIPDPPFVYKGMSPREIITYDQKSSSLMDTYVDQFISLLPLNSSLEFTLQKLIQFVAYTLFDPRLCNEFDTYELIQKFCTPTNEFPEIPLDIFLKAHIGLCRHISLCTALLLDKLIKKDLIKGNVLFIRAETPQGRHAWPLLVSERNVWSIDPYWRILEDAKTVVGWQTLCERYGEKTMEQQRFRWDS